MDNWCDQHNSLESDIKDIKKDVNDIRGDIGEMKGLLNSGALVKGVYLHSELGKVYGVIRNLIGGLVVVIIALGGALAYILKTV